MALLYLAQQTKLFCETDLEFSSFFFPKMLTF